MHHFWLVKFFVQAWTLREALMKESMFHSVWEHMLSPWWTIRIVTPSWKRQWKMDNYYSCGIQIRPSYKLTYLKVHQSLSQTLCIQLVSPPPVYKRCPLFITSFSIIYGMRQHRCKTCSFKRTFSITNFSITLWKKSGQT